MWRQGCFIPGHVQPHSALDGGNLQLFLPSISHQTTAPDVCAHGLVFAFTAESPAALRFLPPFLFSSPTSHVPPASNTWRGQSFRQPRCQPQALSGRSRCSGFSGTRPKLAFPSPSWTRGLSDSCRPKRSAAPSSGHLENCTLRAVLGSFVNRSSCQG